MKRDPRSILHVVAPGPVGGLESVVLTLAGAQVRAGHDVRVFAVTGEAGEGHPFVARLRHVGVEVLPFVARGRSYGLERRAVDEACRRIRPQVVHTHGYRPDVLDAGVARRRGIPTVTTVHGLTGGDWKNRLYEYLQRRAFRRFDAVVAVSRPLSELLARSGVPPERLHMVQNAFAPPENACARQAARHRLGVPAESFLIGWVGRLSHEKGADALVDAMPALRQRDAVAVMVGDGPERGTLEARAAALGAGDRVLWKGVVEDMGRLFSAFDAFVLSSRTEGTPIVLFEAMSAAVPIVATRVGGVPDVVSDQEALLVAPENPAALARAIESVMLDAAGARARAAAASARLANSFGVEPWLARYDEIYLDVQRSPASYTSIS
ncbi:MAG: glycosyltransferase [Gemmatimonadaceae bacterium]